MPDHEGFQVSFATGRRVKHQLRVYLQHITYTQTAEHGEQQEASEQPITGRQACKTF